MKIEFLSFFKIIKTEKKFCVERMEETGKYDKGGKKTKMRLRSLSKQVKMCYVLKIKKQSFKIVDVISYIMKMSRKLKTMKLLAQKGVIHNINIYF